MIVEDVRSGVYSDNSTFYSVLPNEMISTDYWETQLGLEGYVKIVPLHGALRFLVPRIMDKKLIPDILKAESVIITKGIHLGFNGRLMYEFLFEDHSNDPMLIDVIPQQFEIEPNNGNLGQTIPMYVYLEGRPLPIKKFDDVFYRIKDFLPCPDKKFE